MIYAGIDEAGYGPIFGPLVITRSVFSLYDNDFTPESPPSLWGLLKTSVCKKAADKKKRIAVNDSKKIYNPNTGFRHLERGVLAFAGTTEASVPGNMDALFLKFGLDDDSFPASHDWYQSRDGSPKLPLVRDKKKIRKDAARLKRNMDRSRIQLKSLKSAVVFADRFNRMTKSLGSKSGCAWVFVSQHLEYIWNYYGSQFPLAVVDRQGGRRDYLRLLNILFPFTHIEERENTAKRRIYDIDYPGKRMRVIFQVDSEKHHLPVALASMTSKYLRELCMIRFQEFWRVHAPEVRPTFGYFGDGRRFLNEISGRLEELKIDKNKLVRCC